MGIFDDMDFLTITVVILIILNFAVSFYLFKRNDLELFQKIAQVVIVWLFPFVGAIGLWLFHRSQDTDNNKPSGGSFGGGSQDSSIGIGSSGE